MAVSQQMLDDLQNAYYSGATSVSYEGKTISYRSSSEMLGAIQSLKRALGIASPTRVVALFDKGYGDPDLDG